jgi:uncharacterized membrane protein YeaQ/YmgE (transglycosylase-associated protein family)
MSIGDMIGWAVFGLVAGAIARLLHPGRDPMNWLWTMLLGIGGALTGGFIGRSMGFDTTGSLMTWASAIGGSILLLVLYYMATANRARTDSGPASNEDYKKAVFDDLSRGPNG